MMIITRTAYAVALAAFILAAAAILSWAGNAGLIQPEDGRRTIQVIIGLVLAAYANLMPKQLGRPRHSPRAEAAAQAVLRVGGWSLTLAGIAYAGLWAFAPLSIADTASMIAVAFALVVTIAYAVRAATGCRTSDRARDGA